MSCFQICWWSFSCFILILFDFFLFRYLLNHNGDNQKEENSNFNGRTNTQQNTTCKVAQKAGQRKIGNVSWIFVKLVFFSFTFAYFYFNY